MGGRNCPAVPRDASLALPFDVGRQNTVCTRAVSLSVEESAGMHSCRWDPLYNTDPSRCLVLNARIIGPDHRVN